MYIVLTFFLWFSPSWGAMDDEVRSFYNHHEAEISAYTATLPLGPQYRTMLWLQHQDEQGQLLEKWILPRLIETGGPWEVSEAQNPYENRLYKNIVLGYCLMHPEASCAYLCLPAPFEQWSLHLHILSEAKEKAVQLEHQFSGTRWDWHVRHFLAKRMRQYPEMTFESYLRDPCNGEWAERLLNDKYLQEKWNKEESCFYEDSPYRLALNKVSERHRQPTRNSTLACLPQEVIAQIACFLPLSLNVRVFLEKAHGLEGFFGLRVIHLQEAITEYFNITHSPDNVIASAAKSARQSSDLMDRHRTESLIPRGDDLGVTEKFFTWLGLPSNSNPSCITPAVVKARMEEVRIEISEGTKGIEKLLWQFFFDSYPCPPHGSSEENYKLWNEFQIKNIEKARSDLITIYQNKEQKKSFEDWPTYTNPYAGGLIYLGQFLEPSVSLNMLGFDVCPPLIGCIMRMARLSDLNLPTLWERHRNRLLISPDQHGWYRYFLQHITRVPMLNTSWTIDNPNYWRDNMAPPCLLKLAQKSANPTHYLENTDELFTYAEDNSVAIAGPQTFKLEDWESFLAKIAPHMLEDLSAKQHPDNKSFLRDIWQIAGPNGFLFYVQKYGEQFGMSSFSLSVFDCTVPYVLSLAARHTQAEHTERMVDWLLCEHSSAVNEVWSSSRAAVTQPSAH